MTAVSRRGYLTPAGYGPILALVHPAHPHGQSAIGSGSVQLPITLLRPLPGVYGRPGIPPRGAWPDAYQEVATDITVTAEIRIPGPPVP